MRRSSGAFALAVFSCFATGSAAEAKPDVPPSDYFVGKYEVIGRKPDSAVSYSGNVELKPTSGDQFIMVRTIAGHEIKGTAVLDYADPPADHPAVLRIRFVENGTEFEGKLLWRSDLDNYPRLTGLIYRRAKGKTKSAGLEAWFAAAAVSR